MKNKKTLIIIAMIVPLLLLWGQSYFDGITEKTEHSFKYLGSLTLLLITLFIICATWFLYRKEWRGILGLTTKNITGKVIWKSFGIGLLISVVGSIFTVIVSLLSDIPTKNPFGEDIKALELMISALIVAPIIEELMFRGFLQGLWQRFYVEKEKMPIKLIIGVIALLFTVSHFGFLFNISLKQFIITIIPIFAIALYFGWLRYKYQSIIPSIMAHFGFNVKIIFLAVPLIFGEGDFSKMFLQMEESKYLKDTTAYRFNTNDMDEWKMAFKKYTILEKNKSPEFVGQLNGKAYTVSVFFTVDTLGCVYNVRADSASISDFKPIIVEEALRLVREMPPCVPRIIDGKKEEAYMGTTVQIY
jgi:membrane protease YdiL (CAAX protease family)